jgi:hypothetical protein
VKALTSARTLKATAMKESSGDSVYKRIINTAKEFVV